MLSRKPNANARWWSRSPYSRADSAWGKPSDSAHQAPQGDTMVWEKTTSGASFRISGMRVSRTTSKALARAGKAEDFFAVWAHHQPRPCSEHSADTCTAQPDLTSASRSGPGAGRMAVHRTPRADSPWTRSTRDRSAPVRLTAWEKNSTDKAADFRTHSTL